MALRAGYYGLKGSVKKALEQLAGNISGMKIIKSFGDGLNLTNAGKLNLTAATASKLGGIKVGEGLEIVDGVLNATGGGHVELQDVEAITVSANVAVTVDDNSFYAYIGDNNFTVSAGGVVVSGSTTEYVTIDGIGFSMAVIQTLGTSLTINKPGIIIKLDGLTLDYKPIVSGFATGTKSAGVVGSVFMGISGDTDIASDDIDIISSATFTYPSGAMPDFKVMLYRLTETTATFDKTITTRGLSAIGDSLI